MLRRFGVKLQSGFGPALQTPKNNEEKEARVREPETAKSETRVGKTERGHCECVFNKGTATNPTRKIPTRRRLWRHLQAGVEAGEEPREALLGGLRVHVGVAEPLER